MLAKSHIALLLASMLLGSCVLALPPPPSPLVVAQSVQAVVPASVRQIARLAPTANNGTNVLAGASPNDLPVLALPGTLGCTVPILGLLLNLGSLCVTITPNSDGSFTITVNGELNGLLGVVGNLFLELTIGGVPLAVPLGPVPISLGAVPIAIVWTGVVPTVVAGAALVLTLVDELLAPLGLSGSAKLVAVCPAGNWVYSGNNCYNFGTSPTAITQQGATDKCKALDTASNLASMHDLDDLAFITNQLYPQGIAWIGLCCTYSALHVATTDGANANTCKWTDQTPFDFGIVSTSGDLPWTSMYPFFDNLATNYCCTTRYPSGSHEWDLRDCADSTIKAYICKVPAGICLNL